PKDRNDTEGWENFKVLRALKDPLEVGALGANAEVVEEDVLVIVDKLGAGAGLALVLVDGSEDGWVWLCGGLWLAWSGETEVAHDLCEAVLWGGRMVGAAIVKVGNLGPLGEDSLGSQLLGEWET